MKIYAIKFIRPSRGLFHQALKLKKPTLSRVGLDVLHRVLLGHHNGVDDVNHPVAGLDVSTDDRGTVNSDAIAGIEH